MKKIVFCVWINEKIINFAKLLLSWKPLWAKAGVTTIHIEGVTVRFSFDVLELRKLSTSSQKQSNGTPYGMCFTQPSLVLGRWLSEDFKGMMIDASAWGFQRCSFRLEGQCEGLNTWNGWQTGSTFYVYINQRKQTNSHKDARWLIWNRDMGINNDYSVLKELNNYKNDDVVIRKMISNEIVWPFSFSFKNIFQTKLWLHISLVIHQAFRCGCSSTTTTWTGSCLNVVKTSSCSTREWSYPNNGTCLGWCSMEQKKDLQTNRQYSMVLLTLMSEWECAWNKNNNHQ